MDIIINNPFRVLGVFSNASAKDIVANINKAKAYLKVNKEVVFDNDFSSIIPPIKRTIELLDFSQAQINQTNDRVKYALFWFAKESSMDDIAFGHLKSNNIYKAKEILTKRASYSSILNLAVLALTERDLGNAINNYWTLLTDYRFRTDFLHNVCNGDRIKISEEEIIHLLLDTLLEYHSSTDIISALDGKGETSYSQYVKDKLATELISSINSEVSLAKNADRDADSQLRAGKQLAANTKSALQELKIISEEDDAYIMTADNLAKQILQCGINYYNDSNDIDKAKKAYKVQNYALSIAAGQLTRERCKENVDILVEEIDSLPPEKVQREAVILNKKLNSFRNSPKDIQKAIQLIKDSAPYLAQIKEEQGVNGKYYLKISTEIEEAALGITISSVNNALKRLETSNEFEKYQALRNVKSVLEDAWEATQYMSALDLQSDAKNRFNTQKQSLKDLMGQAGVSTYTSVSFKLETETEIFNRCHSKAEYNSFISKFPNGKYTAAARSKVAEIERREQEEKRKLISTIASSTRFSDAIDLFSKCKDTDTRTLLDDKCFSLCQSKSNYKKYLELFGSRAKHSSEAESHLKFDRMMGNVSGYIKEHKGWFIFFCIVIATIIGVGLIWGPSGYSGLLYTLAVISGFIAYGGLTSGESNGCLITIIAGLFCAACVIGGNAIDDYYKDQKKNAEAEKEFRQLGSSPSESECAYFIRNYAQTPHYGEVMDMYLRAAENNGISSLNDFANKYGTNNEYGKRAASRVEQLCDSLYNIANASGSIEGWRTYMSAVPSNYFKDARKKLEEIENIAWNTEAKAWQQATKENTLSAYLKYLDMYPKGAHHSAADKKAIDLQVANIYAGEHGTLPAMDKTGYGGGYTSSIQIRNNTSYTLTLLYSGPDSKRVVLSPQQTSYVSLKNGTYRVAASVSASSVRSFAGTENLSGGEYSVEYYIVTSRY